MGSNVLQESADSPLQMPDEVASGGLFIPAHARLKDAAMLPPSEIDGADLGKVQPQIRLHLPSEGGDELPEEFLLGARTEAVVKLPVEAHPFGRRQARPFHAPQDLPRPVRHLRIHPLGGALNPHGNRTARAVPGARRELTPWPS